MTAGLTAMTRFDANAVARVNASADRAVRGIRAAIETTGARACVTGAGSLFRVHLKERPPRNYREAYLEPPERHALGILIDHLTDSGFIVINTCSAAMSTVTGDAEVDAFVAAIGEGLELVRRLQ